MTAQARPRVHRTVLSCVTALMLALGAIGCGGDDAPEPLTLVNDAQAEAADHEFVIPSGTGLQLDRGEPVEILPGRLDVKVGEVIRIVNDDQRGHLAGPFFVGAGETLTQRFASPGEYVGACTVHPSGQLVLVVSE